MLQLSVRELVRLALQFAPRQLMALLLIACPFAMASLFVEQLLIRAYPQTISDMRLASILSFCGTTSLAYVADAAISVFALPHILRGKTVKNLRFQAKQLVPLLIVALVTPVFVLAGLAVAIVPGIIMAVNWSLAPAATVMGGESAFSALRCSARLTWGSRKSLFFLFAAAHVATIGLSCLAAVASGHTVTETLFDVTPASSRELLFSGLLETVRIAFSGAVSAAFFAEASAAKATIS